METLSKEGSDGFGVEGSTTKQGFFSKTYTDAEIFSFDHNDRLDQDFYDGSNSIKKENNDIVFIGIP